MRGPHTLPSANVGQNSIAFVVGIFFWVGVWAGSRFIFARWSKTKGVWAKLNESKKQLMVSLVNSTVHGTLIPIGVIIDFTKCNIWGDFLSASCSHVEIWFSLTAAYFLVDIGLLLMYPDEELQNLYLVHHAIGAAPYLINVFYCPNLQFLVGAGIIIEAANPCLNASLLLELYGMENSEYAAGVLYFTVLVWTGLRIVLPLYLCWGMITISFPVLGLDACNGGVILTYMTGFLITFFCICVLVVKLIPKMLWFWRGEHRKAAKLRQQ